MKKALSIILCLCMVLSVFAIVPFSATAAEDEITETGASSGTTGDCTWTLNGTELTISGRRAMADYESNSTLPWGKSITKVTITEGVTSIGKYAFYKCSSLTSITIPDSVTSIGGCAFYGCTGLTSVTIPDSVTSIGISVFYGCSSLISVTIPDSVTSIGNYVFFGCSRLTSVTIGNSVTSIGNYAFSDCSSLTSVTIPDSVTSIGDYAFQDCSRLTSVTIPDSVTSIGEWAFSRSAWYDSQPYGLIYAGKVAYKMKGTCPSKVVIKDGTLGIAGGAFSNCTDLISVTIPDSVSSIAYKTFYGCSSLTSVTIPDSVTSIGYSAFYDCYCLTSVTIPDSVTSIGTSAFYCCSRLTSVTIPDSVTSIGYETFRYCSRLTSVTIPDSVSSIGNYVFDDCSSLTSVTIPDSVTSIGDYAFYKCSSLTSVIIPDSVTSIGSSAFDGCRNLTEVHIHDIVSWCSIRFCDYSSNPFYANNANLYLNDDLITNLTIPDTVKSIGNYAFRGCSGLTSVTIPDSVTSIGERAFSDCTSLTSVTIPNSVTSIGKGAFSDCTSLTSVTIPDSVTSISSSAFSGCSSLTSFTIPDSVTSIGDYAFYKCSSLTSVIIPDSVTSIGSSAFRACKRLFSVYIPNSVITIGEYAFGYDSQPTNVGYTKIGIITIYGYKGSKAENYAKNNYFKFLEGIGVCSNCKLYLTDDNLIIDNNDIPATCTKSGLTRSSRCPDCGTFFKAQEVIPALGHDKITDVKFNATCTEDGEVFWHCSRCGELGDDVLPALGHYYRAVVTAATCTKGGYTTYTCSRCKDSYVADQVNALGHDYQAVVTAPICTKGGYTTHTCSRCKDSYVTDRVDPLGHDYHQTGITPPTCTEDGYSTYTCSRCKDSYTSDIVDALGHDAIITVKKAPTTTLQGVIAVDCSRCGLKKNVAVPALSLDDYTITSNTNPCTQASTYTWKDTSYGICSFEVGVPAGHIVTVDPAVVPDWTHDGLTEGSHCSRCGEVFVAQEPVYLTGTTGDCSWVKKGSVLIISGNGRMADYTYQSPAPWINSNITRVIINKGVTSIGDYAFFECNKLVKVYIPDTVVSIGKEAFVDSGITDIYIPSSVLNIKDKGVGYRRIHYSFGDVFDKVSGFCIYGVSNSEAYNYASTYSISFIRQDKPPVIPADIISLGDVDYNGNVEVNDATWILRHSTSMEIPFMLDKETSDIDGDGKVTVMDATAIQYYLADLKTSYKIGKPIN